MKYRVAAIAVIDHALNTITRDCAAGVAQPFRKGKTALLPGEMDRVMRKVDEIKAIVRQSYPQAPARRTTRSRTRG